MTTIKNCPEYHTHYPFCVARFFYGNWWFYGSYDTVSRAEYVAREVGGKIFPVGGFFAD